MLLIEAIEDAMAFRKLKVVEQAEGFVEVRGFLLLSLSVKVE